MVPCSTLEGAPVAQLAGEAENEQICDGAISLLVAPCIAQSGGLSGVDGLPSAIRDVCIGLGTATAAVASASTPARSMLPISDILLRTG